MRNHSYENEFDLHENENEHAIKSDFHMNVFAQELVLKGRQKITKWPIQKAIISEKTIFAKFKSL